MVSLACCGPDGHGDHFGRLAFFLEPNRFLDADFVEGVHGHFHVGEIDPGLVRFDANLDVVVDHPLDGDQYLHRCRMPSRLSGPIPLAAPIRVAPGPSVVRRKN